MRQLFLLPPLGCFGVAPSLNEPDQGDPYPVYESSLTNTSVPQPYVAQQQVLPGGSLGWFVWLLHKGNVHRRPCALWCPHTANPLVFCISLSLSLSLSLSSIWMCCNLQTTTERATWLQSTAIIEVQYILPLHQSPVYTATHKHTHIGLSAVHHQLRQFFQLQTIYTAYTCRQSTKSITHTHQT